MACYDANEMTENTSSNSDEFKLYINNLPEELNEDGLLQIFNHYGQVKEYFYRANANWAYITYDTYLKAENARKDLDNVPPLHLKISYAKKRSSDKGQFVKSKDIVEHNNHDAIVETVTHKQLIQTRGRGNPLDIFKQIKPNPGLPRYTYTANNDLLYPYPPVPCIYNPYENVEPYPNTNALWTRGQLTITPDGKRHVSLGRGYTFYEIPDSKPEVHNYINNVYEKRTLGLYEYGENQLQNTGGICKTCLKIAKYSCQRCNTFYCSRDCQVANWPQHKVECIAIPSLVTVTHSMPESQTNQSLTRNISNIQIPLRLPKKLICDKMKSNEVLDSSTKNENISNVTTDNDNTSDNDLKCSVTKNIDQQNIHKRNDIINFEEDHFFSHKGSAKKETSNKDAQNLAEINSKENVKNHQKFNNDVTQIENDISFSNHTFLSKTNHFYQKKEDLDKFVEFHLVSSFDKRSIVNDISIGEIGNLEIHAEIKNNTYSITLVPKSKISDYEKLVTTLPEICAQVAECSNHRPDMGDFICGRKLDGDWIRGYILSLKPSLKVAEIDTPRVVPINKTVTCPEKFCNICAFGAVCEITTSNIKFNEGDQYEFKVLSELHDNKQKKVIEILQQENKLRAIIKPWFPMPEQKGLELASLESGSEVSITSYQSHTRLFVRSLNTAEVEYYNYILQNVTKCAQTSSFLKEPPVIGEMVIAQYIDKNYYRAIVTQIQDDKITVSYIDFGNIEVTNINKLKILSDNLKQLRCCITKVILKDVPKDVPMTEEVNNYLSMLVGHDLPILCTFDGSPFKDGVYLKLHNGESVNKVICDLLVPTSKEIAEKSKTCYMVNDLNTIDLGNVGDTIDAIILYAIDNGHTYAMCPIDYDLITHVCDIMPKQMTEYCEANNYYIPRDNELCLAFYKEGWYRAVCVQHNYKSTISALFFVDYGNTEFVEHKNIRLMPKDFMSPSAVASICNVINIAPVNSSGLYSPEIEKRLSELVVPDTHIKVKIVGIDSEMYNIELPLIRAQLIEEGLISV